MSLVPMDFDDGNFTEVPLSVNSSYIDANYSKCYSNGKICIVSLCFHVSSLPSSVATNMITGFPSNSNQNYGSVATSGKAGARIRILSGALQFEDLPSGATWCDGNMTYVI